MQKSAIKCPLRAENAIKAIKLHSYVLGKRKDCTTPVTSPWHQHGFSQPTDSPQTRVVIVQKNRCKLSVVACQKKRQMVTTGSSTQNQFYHFNLTPKRPSPPTANLVTDLKLSVSNLENTLPPQHAPFLLIFFFFMTKDQNWGESVPSMMLDSYQTTAVWKTKGLRVIGFPGNLSARSVPGESC